MLQRLFALSLIFNNSIPILALIQPWSVSLASKSSKLNIMSLLITFHFTDLLTEVGTKNANMSNSNGYNYEPVVML